MSLQELEQDPFDPEEFVERLAWRTMGTKARSNPDEFYPMTLHGAFEKMIRDLKDMNTRMQRNVEKLELACQDEEKRHWQRVAELQKTNKESYSHFQELDERINFVATKVVHLGDQLEGVNNPRARAVEAQRLMNYFSEFLSDEPPKSAVFTDPFQLQLAADIIQKLHLVAMELPKGEKFVKARNKINIKYEEIEKELIEEFRIAHQAGERRQMKRVASVLSQFKGYGQCINTFIDECQKGAYLREDLFADIVPLCQRTYQLINEVFTSPEIVMSKLVQNIYLVKLKNNISEQLKNSPDSEKYLQNLFKYYTKTAKLSLEMSKFKLGNDSSFLQKQTKNIFDKYLDTYVSVETKYLRERGITILQRYYHSRDHEKKQLQSGGIHDLRRDIQAKIGTISTKASINIGPVIENYGGETFLSQEVAISILQETKEAFKRCKVLSGPSDLSKNAIQVFEVLVQYLITEHIDYAVELGLQAVPLPDPKSEPDIYYFDVVGQANTIFHLFEKQFSDSLVPLVLSSPQHSEGVQRKRELIEQLENKMDLGLDRSVSAIVGWIRYILATEQKKIDFKNDAEDAPLRMLSPACEKVTKFLTKQVKKIRDGLDGKNVEATLMEIGTRFHRLIFEHFQQFQYNSMGAMLVICDVNEYRKCVKDFRLPLITQLFEKLHALCNLLVVVPENLKQVCTGDQLNGLEKQVLLSFVQLRADYKTAKIANILK